MKKRKFIRITAVWAAFAIMMLGSSAFAAESGGSFEPECLTLAPGSDTSELYMTWYADEGCDGAQLTMDGRTIDAEIRPASSGKVTCRAIIDGLKSGKSYSYQVSNDKGRTVSPEYSYQCPSKGEFEFGYVGDAQVSTDKFDSRNKWGGRSTAEGWQASLSAMSKAGVSFIASAGDNTNTVSGSESEYSAFFSPEEMRSIPYAPAVGNHDRNALFSYHFSYPNRVDFAGENPTTSSGQAAKAEVVGNYYYLYNKALFVVLNDSAYPASRDQAEAFIRTFDSTLKEATGKFKGKYDWLFVQHHKSTESVASHTDDRDIQYYVEAGFEKLMDKYDVDFVLAGHDHVYVRSYVMKDGQKSDVQGAELTDPDGTLYFTANTSSGLKYYALAKAGGNNSSYPYLADGSTGMTNFGPGNLPLGVAEWEQLYTPGYTIVKVDNNKVTFRSYGVDNTRRSIDTVSVTKTSVPAGKEEDIYDKILNVLEEQLETTVQKMGEAEYKCKSRKM